MTADHIQAIRADARRAADLLAYAYPGGAREPSEWATLLASLAGNADLACDEVERLERVQVAIMDRLALMTEKFGIEVEANARLTARVAELEAALRPFAGEYRVPEGWIPDDTPLGLSPGLRGVTSDLPTVGDCRKAAAILGPAS